MHNFCPRCGKKNDGWQFCPDCGSDLRAQNSNIDLNDIARIAQGQADEIRIAEKIKAEFDIENGVLIKYKGNDSIVTIPEGVIEIRGQKVRGQYDDEYISPFENVKSVLKQVILPQSLTTIGVGAFGACFKLMKIEFTHNIKAIKEGAFWGCSTLGTTTIPDSVYDLGNKAFMFCVRMDRIKLSKNIKVIPHAFFWGCETLDMVTIPDGVLKIEQGAFCGCRQLRTIIIPKSVRSLGFAAFSSCKSLRDIYVSRNCDGILSAVTSWMQVHYID